MIKSLVDDFRKGIVDKEKIKKIQKDPYKHFRLQDAVGVRPSVLQYYLPIDNTFLRSVERDISRSKQAGLRVGVEWMPASARSVQIKEEADDLWVTKEDLDPWNDTCTKWCTKKYFPDAFARVNMVANVLRLYDRLRDVTDLRFNAIFKGGVMIRLVLLEFLNDLPLEGRLKAIEYMNKYKALSISDFDFEIVPDNHNSKDDVVHRFFLLDYAVLLWLQREMQREVEKRNSGKPGLLSLDWDMEEAAKELKEYLQEEVKNFPASHPLHKAKVDHVFLGDTVDKVPKGYKTKSGLPAPKPRKNAIIFDCGENKCVMAASKAFEEFGVRGVPATSGGRMFYATLNTYIGEEKKGEGKKREGFWRGVFHLARIKHSFVVFYTTKGGKKCCDRLGGEMIDLSQSHGISKDVNRRMLYKTVKEPYQEYPILGVDPRDVVLRSYSVEGFLFDAMSMIHHTEKEPWEVKKKEKRLVRYVGFLFAHVLSPNVEGSYAKKMHALEKLAEHLKGGKGTLRTGVKPVDEFGNKNNIRLNEYPLTKFLDAIKNYFNTPQPTHMHRIDPVEFRFVRTFIRV